MYVGNMNTTTSFVITTPAPCDVLCSQDANYAQHKGNRILRYLIDQAVESYRQAKRRKDKVRKIDEIVSFMRERYQSRFLKRQNEGMVHQGGWEEIAPQSARDKVSHALRFAVKKRNKKLKAKATSKVQVAKKLQSVPKIAESVSRDPPCQDDDMEVLDERAQIRLEFIHQRQQAILKEMLEESEDLEDEKFSMSCSSNSTISLPEMATSNSATFNSTKDALSQEEVFKIDPIPLSDQRDDSMYASTQEYSPYKDSSLYIDAEKQYAVPTRNNTIPRFEQEPHWANRPSYPLRMDLHYYASHHPYHPPPLSYPSRDIDSCPFYYPQPNLVDSFRPQPIPPEGTYPSVPASPVKAGHTVDNGHPRNILHE